MRRECRWVDMCEEHSSVLRDHSVLSSRALISRSHWMIIAAFAGLLLTTSCGGSERAEIARTTSAGTTVAVLVSKAGSPNVDRPVKRWTYPVDPCADDERNVRAFEYHVPFDPVSGPVRKCFHRPTVAEMIVVCLDNEAKVTSTHSDRA